MSIQQERERYPLSIDGYDVYREVGHGAFAIVYHAKVKHTGEEVAIKVLDLDKNQLDTAEIRKEISIMRSIQHPNVAEIHCTFVHNEEIWMVMPYYGAGSCMSIMRKLYPTGFKDEALLATILKSILQALMYFHKQERMHRDIKAGNILISMNGDVKISDFGVSGALVEQGDRKLGQTFTGTPCWMAPEVVEQSDAGYDTKSDVWSLGITTLELAFGMAPYAEFQAMKVMLLIMQNEPPSAATYKDNTFKFSPAFHSFVRKMLRKSPAKRYTAKALLEHKFIKKAKDNDYIIEKIISLLEAEPELGLPIAICKERDISRMNEQMNKGRAPVSVGSFVFDAQTLEMFKKAATDNKKLVEDDENNEDDNDNIIVNDNNNNNNTSGPTRKGRFEIHDDEDDDNNNNNNNNNNNSQQGEELDVVNISNTTSNTTSTSTRGRFSVIDSSDNTQ